MISSTEAVSSAKANNIVTNLVAMKTAALSYYLDHSDKTPEEINTELTNENLLPYLKKQSQVKDAGDTLKGYSVVVDEWETGTPAVILMQLPAQATRTTQNAPLS